VDKNAGLVKRSLSTIFAVDGAWESGAVCKLHGELAAGSLGHALVPVCYICAAAVYVFLG
jgi:hypothetical protein